MNLQPATLQQRAAKLGELLPRERLHPAVLAWLTRRRKPEPWVIAVSGGVDSVALVLLVWTHFPEVRERLLVVHFNHRLRGRASDADEKFCRDLCRAFNVKFVAGRRRGSSKVKGEADARRWRFEFITTAMEQAGARLLWLGHQQNDIAETLLMRVARGSGTGGLSAPRPVQVMTGGRVHLRPLLSVQRGELEKVMRLARLPWREDASNETRSFFRNRIRLDVLPRWTAAAGRDAIAGAALSRELLAEDDAALEDYADRLAKTMPRAKLDLKALAGAPRAVLRRLLHRWLLKVAGAPALSRQAFELLLKAVEQGESTRQSLGGEGFARIRRGVLYYERNPKK